MTASRSGRPARPCSSGAATIEIYDAVFDRFWRARGGPAAAEDGHSGPGRPRRRRPTTRDEDGRRRPKLSRDDPRGRRGTDGARSVDDEEDLGEADAEPEDSPTIVSEKAYSASEADRHRQFDRMTAAELRDAERLIDLLLPNLERRRTRRSELHHHGRTVAPG